MSGQETKKPRVAVLYTSVFEAIKDIQEDIREEMDLEVNARTISETLKAEGFEAWPQAFGKDASGLVAELSRNKPDIVFNLCECPFLTPEKEMHACALLELLGLPYTGNGPLTLGICNSKPITKRILMGAGLPTPPFVVFTADPLEDPDISYPLVVKPANEDGSAGITDDSFVNSLEDLQRQVAWLKKEFKQNAIAEKFVGGREFNVGLLGNGTDADPHQTLPPSELVYKNPRWRLCTYESKWNKAHPSYHEIAPVCSAEAPQELINRMSRITLECARIFRLTGYARIDFRTDDRGELYILEVNPNPDISPDAGMTRAASAAGISYSGLIREITRLGLALEAR
ncbi:MAG: ATP-grasp domain-containing protein [Syntrophorhabdaceae bacterium]|nr:ATP-grasp domain-containing protein [Syntrophorhabdaceae bacterium]